MSDEPEHVGPHRIMLIFTGFGSFEELNDVVGELQDDGEGRGLFADIVMMNAMSDADLADFGDDHPLVKLAKESK